MERTKKCSYNTTLTTDNYTCNAQSLEEKIAGLLANNSPIDSISPMYYTEKKDGVKPETDIRTDRWEIAVDTADKVNASLIAARAETMNPNNKKED